MIFFLLFALHAEAKLKVVATTSDLGAIVKEIGGSDVELDVIAKGTQDPHFIEAKPSYMVKMRDADLVVSNGLSLEIGWLPSLVRGARNPKISTGTKGDLDLGSMITPIEKPNGKITRAMGDVHPDGNPHFTLDPVRVGEVGEILAGRLGELDASHKDAFTERAKKYKARLAEKVAAWKKRIDATGVKKVVTYHSTLNYFLDRFGLTAVAELEPKPGVPPTTQSLLNVISTMKNQNVKLVMVENFFDTKIADRVVQEIPTAKVKSVGVAVESAPGLNTLEDVTEELVKTIEASK